MSKLVHKMSFKEEIDLVSSFIEKSLCINKYRRKKLTFWNKFDFLSFSLSIFILSPSLFLSFFLHKGEISLKVVGRKVAQLCIRVI